LVDPVDDHTVVDAEAGGYDGNGELSGFWQRG
jgi:hypothetical protein